MLLPVGRGIVIVHTGKSMVRACGWACPPWPVTVDPSHVLPWAWQCQLMRWTTTVGICWQQGREEGGEDVEWMWLCGGCCPAHTGNKVSCGVGGVVQWP